MSEQDATAAVDDATVPEPVAAVATADPTAYHPTRSRRGRRHPRGHSRRRGRRRLRERSRCRARLQRTRRRPVVFDDLGDLSFSDAIDATIVEFDDGDLVSGTVVKIDNDEVLLDIGYKSEGVIPSRELSIRNDVNPTEVVSLDEELEALVLHEGRQGRPAHPVEEAGAVRAGVGHDREAQGGGRRRLRPGHRSREGRAHPRHRPAGLPARVARRPAACPRPAPFVGKTLECKIIELDKNRNNVVLSRRAYLEETQREQRDEFLTNLKSGEVRQGVVSSVVNFGAFVDLGGMDGLVHVSELSWKHVDHPSSVVQVGDEVTVQVLDVDLSAVNASRCR